MERTEILEIKNQKKWFLQKQKVTQIDDIAVKKILVSKEALYDTKNPFKYFVGYNDNGVIRPLCIKLRYLKVIQQCLAIAITRKIKD